TRRLRRGTILGACFIAGISMEGWVGSAGGAGRPRPAPGRRDDRLALEGTTGRTGPEPSTDAWHRSRVCAGPGVGQKQMPTRIVVDRWGPLRAPPRVGATRLPMRCCGPTEIAW